MIETRTFEGDPAELAAFCVRVWKARYQGKMAYSAWSGGFFDWELFFCGKGGRDLLIAAYDGTRLVGALPGRRVDYHWRGEPVTGSCCSYFSVEPEYDSHGVSLKLWLEQRRRHRDRQLALMMGYLIVGSKAALGKEFWLRMKMTNIVSKLGLWARIIDHSAVAHFLKSRDDSIATRVLGCFQDSPREPSSREGIRPFGEADLSDCLRLTSRLSESADFGIVWDRELLSRQLSFKGVPRTIVAEHDGKVGGFVNYFHLELIDRREVRAGLIDLLSVEGLPPQKRRNLVQTALKQMTDEGCHLALLLRVAGQSNGVLWRTGFVPQPREYCYVSQAMMPDAPSPKTRRLHVTWR
jgi:hypothetical protein